MDSPMAKLLSLQKQQFVRLTRGTSIKGHITKLTPQEILVDIKAKTEAVVLEKDKKILKNLLSFLKVGDEVEVGVLTPESDMGYPVVSLRHFMENKLWERLEKLKEKQEKIPVRVSDVTRGGFLIETQDGISGFLPQSHSLLAGSETEGQQVIGRTIDVYVLDLQRATNKIIFSQKASMDEQGFLAAIRGIKIGQKISAIVSNITNFGIFVNVHNNGRNIDGLIHISELSWEKVEDIQMFIEVGKTVDALVIGIDTDAKRLDLSLKQMEKDPFEEVMKKYTVDQRVTGVVLDVVDAGITLELETGVDGLIRKEKIPVGQTFEIGQRVEGTVAQIDAKRHRVVLVPVLLRKTIGYR